MNLTTIPTVYYPWSYNAKWSKMGFGAVYNNYGQKDVVDYVHDEDYKNTITSIANKIVFTGENLAQDPIKKNIDITKLECDKTGIIIKEEYEKQYTSLRNIVPLTQYQNMMKKIKDIDPYINNYYCYIRFLQWVISNKPNIHNNNQLVCVGHSNKMKNLEKIIRTNSGDVNRIEGGSETEELLDSPINKITFIRHGFSCNNTTGAGDKDWDPSLTVYGMLTAIKMGTTIAKTYSDTNSINVCVSPLLRTWQTAILLFGKNYDTINLNICPYLTEAYPDLIDQEILDRFKIKSPKLPSGRGNTPIEFRWQLKKLYHFLQLLIQNKDALGLKNEDALGFNAKLTTINIQFVGMDTIMPTLITIKNDTINFTYNEEPINMTEQKTTVYKNDQTSNFSAPKLSGGSEHEEHNMWRIELTVDNNMITNTNIIDGVPKPKFKTKRCEKGCAFNGTFYGNTRYNKEKCDESLKTVTERPSTDVNRISDDDFSRSFRIKEKGGIELVKPSLLSRIGNLFTRKNKKVYPSSGGKNNHRKTNKKHRSRKYRR